MTTLIVLICIALLLLIIVQVARVRDLAKQLRGSEEVEAKATAATGRGLLFFMVALLVICSASALYYKNYILGFGPNASASLHGEEIDSMMKWTLAVTYVAFILTHIFLFWYAYKYRSRKGHKAVYLSHNNTIELVWTGIPAIVMTFLVVGGLDAWNTIMSDVGEDDNYMEIEANGRQFLWTMRYPGPDGLLGRTDFRLISGTNPLGQDWTDPKNYDDIIVNDVTLPVDQKVRVRITAMDVLHDFYLPQFRVKMDAVPGLPTYFVFTPRITSKEWRKGLSEYPEYQLPDPANDGEEIWKNRDFELACAELCGTGHWSMARKVIILEQDEFDTWYAGQSSWYTENIKGTPDDPMFIEEMDNRSDTLNESLSRAIETPEDADNFIDLNYITFEEGSADLTKESEYQLEDVLTFLEDNDGVEALLMGHTAASDEEQTNLSLSEQRARSVRDYLTERGVQQRRLQSKGYGSRQLMAGTATSTPENGNSLLQMYIKVGETDAAAGLSK